MAIVSVVVFAADRLSKELVWNYVPMGERGAVRLLRGVLYARANRNQAGFLDALEGAQAPASTWVFLGGSLLFALFVGWLIHRSRQSGEAQALSLVLAGVLGNGFDRAVHGHVIDCALLVTPVRVSFNVADLAIFVGIVWTIGYHLRSPRKPVENSES